MKLLLQFPEGLKQKAVELAKKYEKEGHEVFLSASPCYGACDIAIDEARWLKVDKIIHFGHNKFGKLSLEIPVEYVEYRIDIDVKMVEKALPKLKAFKTLAVGMTVQNSHQFNDVKKLLEKDGKTVLADKGPLTQERGQVLGCDAHAVLKPKADAILFIGNGMFHPLAIETEKPVFVLNPSDGSIKQINDDIMRLKKKRKGAILKALECKNFGILVSTKPGQFSLAHAKWAKRELQKRGFLAEILVANEFEPITINNFLHFDAYINTACPRIADDSEEFGKPLLTISMLNEMFKLFDKLSKTEKE